MEMTQKEVSYVVESTLRQLKELENQQRAFRDKVYHKSNREHWGIPMANRDQVLRSLCQSVTEKDLLAISRALWETNLFDPMMCAIKLLTLPKIKPSQQLWELVVCFLKTVDGWALEDGLAPAAWKCILSNETLLDTIEDQWIIHENFWIRRAALVYTLPFAKKNKNPERPLSWASLYSTDPQWFIQKAIGWWLRVLGEHDPQRVISFLKLHWHQLKPVARRESTRKLKIQWQHLIP